LHSGQGHCKEEIEGKQYFLRPCEPIDQAHAAPGGNEGHEGQYARVHRRMPHRDQILEEERGKRNEPAYLREIAEMGAAVKELSLEVFAAKTTENAARIFGVEFAD